MAIVRRAELDSEMTEKRYGNWLKQYVDMVCPKNLYLFMGRGGGKTTDFVSERMMDVVYDMPGCYIALAADTYMNALKNIVPSILEGLERKGWIEGVHYVKDTAPPPGWGRPYKPVMSWKHTITFWNGAHCKIVSMDRPSTGAGDSYQHIFGDEVKYLKEKKLKKLFPAIRGEFVRFGNSPLYRGQTFTGDVGNLEHGEDNWMMRMKPRMNKEQIKLILQAAVVLNSWKVKYIRAVEKKMPQSKINIIEQQIKNWEARWKKIRKNSVLFHIASSYVNVDILTRDYFIDQLETMDVDEFITAILSIPPKLEEGKRFYSNLKSDHFYADGYNYDYYDEIKLGDIPADTSLGLRYVRPSQHLEAGFDAGNMMSLVVGQLQGNTMRLLKNHHTLAPENAENLGRYFVDFWRHHKTKVLHLYYDRAANNYSKIGKDFATELKNSIEYGEDGKHTGWVVKMMNKNQGIIQQVKEWSLMIKIMGETDQRLPKLMIDQHECKELKSSLEKAPIIIKQIGDKRIIKKDKSSEKTLKLSLLPMHSTNYSDAFKYLMCRPEWLDISESAGKVKGNWGSSTPVIPS